MKISHYISGLIISCMTFGLISAGIFYFQAHSADQSQIKLYNYTSAQNRLRNVSSLLSQWLTTLDLFLANKQTYIHEGLQKEANVILDLTSNFNEDLNENDLTSINEFRIKITNIKKLVLNCQRKPTNTNFSRTLSEVDAISENIDLPIKKAERSFSRLITLQNQVVSSKHTRMNFLAYAILGLMAVLTILLLYFTDKFITGPIESLTSITEKKYLKPDDFDIKGPDEVKILSKKFGKYIMDIIETKEALINKSLLAKHADARKRNIMDTAGDAIVCTDSDGFIIEMNKSFLNLIKNDSSNKNLNLNDIIPDLELNVHSEDEMKLISMVETELVTKKGDKVTVEISTSSFTSEGSSLFTIVIRDVSERKILMDQLINAQKLESIGRLAAGIAHEINTPAQYILDYNSFIEEGFENISEFLKKVHDQNIRELEDYAEEKDISFYEQEIPQAIKGSIYGLEQISKIVKSVKGFTYPKQTERTEYSINTLINNTVNVSRNEWKYDAEVILNLDENIPKTFCFPVRLNQVFLNMLINSTQSIIEKKSNNKSHKGVIEISTHYVDEMIEIKICDNGNGIPNVIKDKVFEPFFTTKEVGIGTGQGLALTWDFIVNKHKGKISFISEEGKGTEFTIELPIITKSEFVI